MSEDVVNFFHGLKPPIATSLAGFTASSLLGYDLTFEEYFAIPLRRCSEVVWGRMGNVGERPFPSLS